VLDVLLEPSSGMCDAEVIEAAEWCVLRDGCPTVQGGMPLAARRGAAVTKAILNAVAAAQAAEAAAQPAAQAAEAAAQATAQAAEAAQNAGTA
jgi:hypothetical protein